MGKKLDELRAADKANAGDPRSLMPYLIEAIAEAGGEKAAPPKRRATTKK